MKIIQAIATLAFVFPLTILPNSKENCANDAWQFQSVSNTPYYEVATKVARAEFCRVVADNFTMWN